MKTFWDKQAYHSFTRELMRTRKRSIQRAAEMENEVISAIDGLSVRRELCSPDRFMRGNKGSFRLFRVRGLNISCFIDDEYGIFILRVLHWRRTNK